MHFYSCAYYITEYSTVRYSVYEITQVYLIFLKVTETIGAFLKWETEGRSGEQSLRTAEHIRKKVMDFKGFQLICKSGLFK